MELDLDLSLSPHTNLSKLGFQFDLNKGAASCLSTKKPCLFSLNGQPNEEDEDEDPFESDSSIVYDEEESSEVVGWPPIKSCMTKYHNYHHHSRNHPYHHHGRGMRVLSNTISHPTATIERVGSPSSSSSTTSSRSSMYVKVKMEGVAIARKVDIMLFNSYKSLTNSLITMFSQYEGCDKEDANFTFTFQGKEGDWLLPGDAPWKIFAESVHRISITRDRPFAYTRLLF